MVPQTQNKDGYIVDNPKVGPMITDAYWKHGNSRPFLDLVKDLTGKDLTGNAWVDELKESVKDKISRERKEYDEMIEKKKTEGSPAKDIDLQMNVNFVDGDELISSSIDGGLLSACEKFEAFVAARVAAAAEAASTNGGADEGDEPSQKKQKQSE